MDQHPTCLETTTTTTIGSSSTCNEWHSFSLVRKLSRYLESFPKAIGIKKIRYYYFHYCHHHHHQQQQQLPFHYIDEAENCTKKRRTRILRKAVLALHLFHRRCTQYIKATWTHLNSARRKPLAPPSASAHAGRVALSWTQPTAQTA